MRDLTRAELEEYFEHTARFNSQTPEGFSREQAVLLAAVLRTSGVVDRLMLGLLASPVEDENIPLSLCAVFFQMGRECESRLLSRALKSKLK